MARRTDDRSDAMAKHMAEAHPDCEPNFSYKVDRAWKTSLARQIRESLLIAQENPEMLLNSKGEWGSKNVIPRLVVQDSRLQAEENDALPDAAPSDLPSRRPRNDLSQSHTQQKRRKRNESTVAVNN